MPAPQRKSVSLLDTATSSAAVKKPVMDVDKVFGKKTVADIKKGLSNLNIEYVKVGFFDIDGILRGKYMKVEKFVSALDNGFGFCDVVMGWDSNDQLYDSAKYTGWHTAYPDAEVRIVTESVRAIPFEDNIPFFICELAGKGETVCPRGLLKRVIDRAHDMGFVPYTACEFEFFMFDETPETIREIGFKF